MRLSKAQRKALYLLREGYIVHVCDCPGCIVHFYFDLGNGKILRERIGMHTLTALRAKNMVFISATHDGPTPLFTLTEYGRQYAWSCRFNNAVLQCEIQEIKRKIDAEQKTRRESKQKAVPDGNKAGLAWWCFPMESQNVLSEDGTKRTTIYTLRRWGS